MTRCNFKPIHELGEMFTEDKPDALLRLRNFLAEHSFALNDRLAPERELCQELGLTRATLRAALAVLENEGQVWRHVGRGTFIGARPVLNLDEVKFLTGITTPAQILDARVAIEPELARLAARHGNASHFTELLICAQRCQEAKLWRVFEAWDSRFHYAIAASTRNKLLGTMFETLNAVRRSVVWRTVRVGSGPAPDYPSFNEHQRIYEAIRRQDEDAAADNMRQHLGSVRSRLILPEKPPKQESRPS
jgi:DNA-binding FadR family transcriptional regulator